MAVSFKDRSENICDILKTVDKSISHYDRYQSRYKNNVIAETTHKNKGAYRTMGRPETAPPNPQGFLRRGAGLGGGALHWPSEGVPMREHKQRCLQAENKRPPLPPRIGRPAERAKTCVPRQNTENYNYTKSSDKNWQVHNILQAVNSKACFPPMRYVDKEKGDKHDLEKSGLVPKYIYRKNYGKTPNYIKKFQRQSQIAEERRKQEEDLEKRRRQSNGYLSQDERQEILQGLKHNHMQLQEQFNKLPLLVDTISKSNLKTMLEIQLRTLEKDILSIEENKYIYVYNDEAKYF